jgi:glycosyltransferase involved in cell wall biosynthesis
MSTPRVVVLGMGWFPDQLGGLNRYVRGLVQELGETRAIVLGPAEDAPARVTAVSDKGAPLPARLLAVRRAMRAAVREADVVDAHFALTAFAALRVLGRKPLVVHFHGPWAAEGAVEGASGLAIAVKRWMERRVYRRARAVVTLSNAFKQILVAGYGVDPRRVHVIPAGVELDRFAPGDRVAARDRFGLPHDSFVVVTARRLVPRMGNDVMLAALPDDAILLIAGDGPERAKLEPRAGANVRFLGRISDDALIELYRAADVSIVPSLTLEGFGLSAAESLACGTPVIVSDSGGLPEVVAGLDETLVVPAGDPLAITARLLRPLPTREECRAHAERFSWPAVAARHRRVYREAAKPRVVFLDHTAVLSGGELALLRVLPDLDVDAHVILAQDGPFADELRFAGATVEILPLEEDTRDLPRERVLAQLPIQTFRALRHARRLARRLRELDPDVVHTNSLKSALYGGVASRLAGVPVVWHIRDRIAPDYLPRSAVLLVRAAARFLPTAIVANSRETLSTLPKRRPAFVVSSPVAEAGPRRNGADGPLRVGMVGRIAPWKGQHVFLDAFARAFGDGDERARIVGAPMFGADEEAYGERLLELTGALGLNERVEFTGFRSDVAGELAHLDVLVHASVLPEPFGQVVVEGMAAGLPVVAAAAGGPAEIIDSERTGLLYPPGDADLLANALLRLAGDVALRRRLGDAARESARAYSPAAVARQLEAVFRSVR